MRIKHYIELVRRTDWLLFSVMVALAVASVLFIYSASYHGPGQPIKDFYKMQMIWFVVGLVIYLAVSFVDYRLICQWATVWYVVAIGLLVLVLVTGQTIYGARRWLGWHGFGIQPAETAKLATLLTVSYYLFHHTLQSRRQLKTVGVTVVMMGVPRRWGSSSPASVCPSCGN